MKITVAICTYNHASSLREMLRSLSAVELPKGADCEVLIVDNGSTDDTAQVAQSYKSIDFFPRYMYEPRRGQSHARNTALMGATGDVIAFTDDDVRVPPNWLTQLCEPIISGTQDAVAGGVKLAPHLRRFWMTWLHRAWLASTEDTKPAAGFSLVGANMAFSRNVLRKVPAFDVELGPGALGFHDDSLFSAQLREAGLRIGWTDVTVEHHCDLERLQRCNLIETARKMGASSAYWAHHWEHEEIGHPRSLAALWRAKLERWRLTKPAWTHSEGMPEWEMWMLWQYYKYRYFVTERRRARNYMRRGLVKIAATPNSSAPRREFSRPWAKAIGKL